MYLEIYIDVLFFINFLMDIILLKILQKIRKLNSTTIRLMLAGIIGAANACMIALLPNLNSVIKFIFMYIITSYLMVIIAFRNGNRRERIKNIVMLFIITFFLGGFFNSLYYYTNLGYYFGELLHGGLHPNIKVKYLILLSPLFFIIVKLFIKALEETKRKVQNIYEVELKFNNQSVNVKGLFDTGNSLKEPISKKPVAIAEYGSIKALLPTNLQDIIETYLEDGTIDHKSLSIDIAPFIRFIPYKSIGKDNGMLIGVIFKEVMVHSLEEVVMKGSKEKDHFVTSNNIKVIIAMHKGKLSNNDDYQIILHKELL